MTLLALAAAVLPCGPAMAGAGISPIKVASSAWRKGAACRVRADLGDTSIQGLAWSSDSKRIAVIRGFPNSWVLDANSGKRLVVLPGPREPFFPSAALFTPDDKYILASGQIVGRPADLSVAMTLMDARSGAFVREIKGLVPEGASNAPVRNVPQRIVYDHDHSKIVFAPQLGLRALEVLDPGTWTVAAQPLTSFAFVNKFALRPGSNEVAFIRGRGGVQIFDRVSGVERANFQAMPADVDAIEYSPDGSLLLTTMVDLGDARNDMDIVSVQDAQRHKVVGWYADNLKRAGAINENTDDVFSVQFHPDGGIFAVGTYTSVLLFDRASFQLIRRINIPSKYFKHLAFSPDGSALAVSSNDELCVLAP